MMGPYWYGWGGGWMVIGWLMMVVVGMLVVAGVVVAVKWAAGRGWPSRQDASEAPVDILRRRYAAGELTKEQFETMKRDVA
jgi:putative membrane protein